MQILLNPGDKSHFSMSAYLMLVFFVLLCLKLPKGEDNSCKTHIWGGTLRSTKMLLAKLDSRHLRR
jgi:hypothetical protein